MQNSKKPSDRFRPIWGFFICRGLLGIMLEIARVMVLQWSYCFIIFSQFSFGMVAVIMVCSSASVRETLDLFRVHCGSTDTSIQEPL